MARGPAELPKKLAAYVAAVGVRETAAQRRLRAVTRRLPRGSMQIGCDQGAFMQVLVRAIGARRCLEVGTFTGYSALAVALALPPGGRMVCCDVSEEWTAIAKKYWRMAGVSGKIQLRLAPALETLKRLKGPFDFAFIDADKANLQAYFERCLKLVRRRGLVAVDNTLWHGTVVQPRDKSVDARAVRAFNRRLRTDRRVEIALVPIGDGLTLAWKR
jgi:caffeoyl-CoA O-methyltransferase